MTKYNIDPQGINGVLKNVNGVLKGELTKARQSTYDALDEAVLAFPDGGSPVEQALRVAQARAVMAVNAVSSETGFIVSVAVDAATEYLKADDRMAAGAKHREAAARDVDAFSAQPGIEAKTHQLDLQS
ncbi:DUF6507 family protein [Rugosimonospora africana]|uniref:Uncharacterized protein n=1 Tax=Rugosimonospora africana TaxID=556532 RepID=A0A8J3QX06_9ACTN|nr:DUF6507 family protein [Rugosimonospora africana]GIH17657.1 hypothetical protein Raf01_58290 [Rugosimonospora africana]